MGIQNGTAKAKFNFEPIFKPMSAVFKPTIPVIQTSLMAHGQVSVRGHPMGRPGWCGTVVGAAGRLLFGARRAGQISGNRPHRHTTS